MKKINKTNKRLTNMNFTITNPFLAVIFSFLLGITPIVFLFLIAWLIDYVMEKKDKLKSRKMKGGDNDNEHDKK